MSFAAGQYLITSVDVPVTGQFTQARPDRPGLGFGMTLEPDAIAELLAQAGPADPPPGAAPAGIAVSPYCLGTLRRREVTERSAARSGSGRADRDTARK